MDILGNQVHPVVRMFTNNDAFFEDGSSPILIARSVLMHFSIFPGQHNRQTWNVFEPPWSVLESRVRSRFPCPSPAKQLEDVLLEKPHVITLAIVQNLCESIPRRTQAVLQARGDPTLY
jgi:hypothetical protein